MTYDFQALSHFATCGIESSGSVAYSFEVGNYGAMTQQISGAYTFDFAYASAYARTQDSSNPGPAPTQSEPPGVIAARDIVFDVDVSGLTTSTGASIVAPSIVRANGAEWEIRPEFLGAPSVLISADVSRLGVSARSTYGPFIASGVADFGYCATGKYANTPYLRVDADVPDGATVSGDSALSVLIDGVLATSGATRASLADWQERIEFSSVVSGRGFTTAVRTYCTHLQDNGSNGAGLLSNAAPYINGWMDHAGTHVTPSDIGIEVVIFPRITGGTWTVSVDGVSSEAIPYNASESQIESAINSIPAIVSRGGVAVSVTDRQDDDTRWRWLISYIRASSGQIAPSPNVWTFQPVTNALKIKLSKRI